MRKAVYPLPARAPDLDAAQGARTRGAAGYLESVPIERVC